MPTKQRWFYVAYRASSNHFLVLAHECKAGHVRLIEIEMGDSPRELPGLRPFPDLRRIYPYPWSSLGPVTRAQVRALVKDGHDECIAVEFPEEKDERPDWDAFVDVV